MTVEGAERCSMHATYPVATYPVEGAERCSIYATSPTTKRRDNYPVFARYPNALRTATFLQQGRKQYLCGLDKGVEFPRGEEIAWRVKAVSRYAFVPEYDLSSNTSKEPSEEENP